MTDAGLSGTDLYSPKFSEVDAHPPIKPAANRITMLACFTIPSPPHCYHRALATLGQVPLEALGFYIDPFSLLHS